MMKLIQDWLKYSLIFDTRRVTRQLKLNKSFVFVSSQLEPLSTDCLLQILSLAVKIICKIDSKIH